RDLLLHDVPEAVVGHARTAELLGYPEADDAGLARGDPRRPLDEALLLPPLVVRFDLAGEDFAHGLPVRLVIVVEMGAFHGFLGVHARHHAAQTLRDETLGVGDDALDQFPRGGDVVDDSLDGTDRPDAGLGIAVLVDEAAAGTGDEF